MLLVTSLHILALVAVPLTAEETRKKFNVRKWRLVFHDEFSGDTLDTSKWEYQEGCSEEFGAGNLQCYVVGRNNIKLKDGIATITAKVQQYGDKEFTSGRFRQLGNGFLHGYFVVRARLPDAKHLWPALWLLTRKDECYQEIDIMEAKGDYISRMVFTAHYGYNFTNLVRHGTANNTGINFSREFHNFGVLWTKEKLAWYIDDTKYYEVPLDRGTWASTTAKPCIQGPFTQKMNFILNVAVGGTFFAQTPFSPEEAQQWKKPTMEIDWLRIFQYDD